MKSIIYFCLLNLTLFSCTTDDIKIKDPDVNPISSQELHASIKSFSFKMLKNTVDKQENTLISPLSIHTALSMTANGAANTTLSQMSNVLSFGDKNINQINGGYKEAIVTWNNDANIKTANALFSDPSRINLYPDFLKNVEENYNASHRELNFSRSDAVTDINKWAEDKTEGRIKKVLEKIEDNEILFLLNAIYFKADWALGFMSESTERNTFTNADGSKSEVDMMISDNNRSYFIDDKFSVLDMDMKGNKYAMSFIQTYDQAIHSFVNSTKAEDMALWYDDMIKSKIALSRLYLQLPKFEVSSKMDLNNNLVDLGMGDAFNKNAADLSLIGTSPLGNMYISRVLHDAFLKVDEKGIEGAAVTTVGIAAESLPPTIKFDKPFMFVIRDKESNMPVFMGVVNKL